MSTATGLLAKSSARSRAFGSAVVAALLALSSCAQPPAETRSPRSTAPAHQDLLVGYDLLADTLADESHLGTLDLFKTLTLNAPNDAVAKLMHTLSDASKRRASELERLRHLAPDVSDEPTTPSPIGDAITDVAKEFGKSEMLSRSGGFDVRFVLLQAQATRMVAAMATATARFDPNAERKAWLKSLANEFEGYRRDLIRYIEPHDKAR
ncbi:MAG: hypothetical protein IPK07_31370 [Deltaproteobacteria bacterium]|nr:hypothetical protein [Deltaproteobacteria bacterium]